MTTNLYETDYGAWLEQQANALKNHDVIALDWDNLSEEIEELGKSEKDAVESLLTRLYEHAIKIYYWESERERNLNHWRIEINAFRKDINKKLKRHPNLKTHLDEVDPQCWQTAVSTVSEAINLDIPLTQVVDWKTATTDRWYPKGEN